MIKLNKKYVPLFNSQSRYFVVTGGRGSGKSYALNSFLLLLTYEVGHTILFTRYTLTSAHISIIPEFTDKIETAGLSDDFYITKDEIINTKTNSKIIFKGIKTSSGTQTANLKSLAGVTTFVLDEAEELVDEDVFDKIDLSVRHNTKQNRVILILNPVTKEHFIYKRFFESKGIQSGQSLTKGNSTYIHTTYLDNLKNLSESFIQQVNYIEQSNPKKYQHAILGGWLDKAEGVVFTNWQFGTFNPNGLQTSFGMDFGFSIDPDALTEVAIDKKKKIIYIKEVIYERGLKTHVLAQLMKDKVGGGLIIADSAEPRLIDDLRYQGLNIQAVKKGTIESGIIRMQDYQIIVEHNSTNIAKEFNNYVYLNKASKLYIDDWNHCFIGSTLITTNKGQIPIKEIKVGDLVLTSKGFRKVTKKHNNGLKQVCRYLMQFDKLSLYLSGTKTHHIKTDKTWTEIQHLKKEQNLYLLKTLWVENTIYTQMKDIFQKVVKDCIGLYGNILKVKYQKDTKFITTIPTHQTIELKIYRLLVEVCMLDLQVKKGLKKIQISIKNFIQKVLNVQKNGINQKKVKNGMLLTGKNLGLIDHLKNLFVKNVEKNTKQDILEFQNFAITTAKLRTIEGQDYWMEEVYDLSVEDVHEYFANGVLVHNCIDSARYNIIYHLDNPNQGVYHIY